MAKTMASIKTSQIARIVLDRRFLVVTLHTVIAVVTFWDTSRIADDIHRPDMYVHPVFWIADFPAMVLYNRLIELIDAAWSVPYRLRPDTFFSQVLMIVLFGGLQWILIVSVYVGWNKRSKKNCEPTDV